MKAAVITAPDSIEVCEVGDPAPGNSDVVIEVAASGLCGTDLHVLSGGHGRLPVIPGHEVSGIVVAIGRDANEWRVGDRVAVDPNLPCRQCRECRRGRGNLCGDLQALGITQPGGAAELMVAPAANCYRVPDHLPLPDAALAEPLSCAVHAFDVLRASAGSSVLIYGAGPMGLLLLALAGGEVASYTDVVETNPDRREVAAKAGASQAVASVDELEQPHGWDVVIDATGVPAVIQNGLSRVARGGTFLQVGVAPETATVNISPYDVYRREITVAGSMAVLNSFQRAVDLLAAAVVNPELLITTRSPLDETPAAFTAFAGGAGLKTLIVP